MGYDICRSRGTDGPHYGSAPSAGVVLSHAVTLILEQGFLRRLGRQKLLKDLTNEFIQTKLEKRYNLVYSYGFFNYQERVPFTVKKKTQVDENFTSEGHFMAVFECY